jgi:hypothetical protein
MSATHDLNTFSEMRLADVVPGSENRRRLELTLRLAALPAGRIKVAINRLANE